jgi:pimeloyl-ACP methyl ester carboxylesterase
VERLALLNIMPLWPDLRVLAPNAWRFAYAAFNAAPLIGRVWQQTPLLERALVGVPPEDRSEFAAPFREPARAKAGQAYYRTALLRDAPILASRYADKRLTMPTYVLHGAQDPVIRPEFLPGFSEHGDDVRIDLIPDAGHFIADEQPDLVADRLGRFFRG